MEYLNTFLTLISKTDGRDKSLRLIQFATLNAAENDRLSTFAHIYNQIRNTRKVLRFLRTLQYGIKIRHEVPQTVKDKQNFKLVVFHILSISQNLFGLLYFLSDHRVFLSQIGIIDKSHRQIEYRRSYKLYLFQNIIGVIKNIVEIGIIISEGKHEGKELDLSSGTKMIKRKAFDLIKSLLDCLVALYYLNKILPAKKIGIVGIITSVMSIMQILNIY